MKLPSPRLFNAALVGAVCIGFFSSIGCSSSEPKEPQNTISPYDPEFDAEESSAESDLPEEELLERAKSAYDGGLYTVARENWNKLREQYPSSYYATMAELKIADSYFYSGDYATAVTSYEEFIKLHPAHDATPYIRFQIGNAHKEQYSGVAHDSGPLQAALKSYRRLIQDFPKSDLVLPAREQIALCRELLAANELKIAEFYGKQERDQARIKRLEILMREYPETDAARQAQTELSESAPGVPTMVAESSSGTVSAGPARGTKPEVPELLGSSGPRAETELEKRARMHAAPIEERSLELNQTLPRTTSSAGMRTEPNFVNCKEENNMFVFTAQFSRELVLVGRATGDENAFVLRERSAPMPKVQGEGLLAKRMVKECEMDTAGLRFFAVENNDSVFVAKLEKSSTNGAVHAFTLDRPARFVVIVEK